MKRGTMFETTRANGVLRIFNHLLRISTLIIIGCPTMNNGSYIQRYNVDVDINVRLV